MKKLTGKWALVTGSSRGIGRQIALGLAERECNVIVHGRQRDHTRSTLDLLAKYSVETCAVEGDLAEAGGIESVIEGVKAGPGYVDILYNNAAINNTPTPIFEFTPADWLTTFQVNLFAMVQLCTAFAPGMRERQWGRIINMTSGIAGQPNLAPYSASKAAVDKYTQDLAAEFANENILVNHVDPGWIKTDLGGPNAWDEVTSVVPGVLVPALLNDNGTSGKFFAAQDFKCLER